MRHTKCGKDRDRLRNREIERKIFEGNAFNVYLFANYDSASFVMPLFFMCCIFLSSIQCVYCTFGPLTHIYTHIGTRTRCTSQSVICMCTQHINAYQQIHSHRYTHALHINRLVAIVFFYLVSLK